MKTDQGEIAKARRHYTGNSRPARKRKSKSQHNTWVCLQKSQIIPANWQWNYIGAIITLIEANAAITAPIGSGHRLNRGGPVARCGPKFLVAEKFLNFFGRISPATECLARKRISQDASAVSFGRHRGVIKPAGDAPEKS